MLLRLVCAALILAMGCSEDRQETNASTITERPAPEKAHSAPTGPVYGYTYGEATGNRLVEGQGRLQEAKPVDVELSGTPDWVAGAALALGSAFITQKMHVQLIDHHDRIELSRLGRFDDLRRLLAAGRGATAAHEPLMNRS